MANTGGRVSFEANSIVRILKSDGRISEELYEVETSKSDRKGQVSLKLQDTDTIIRVQFRRILPSETDGKSVVIESGGKYRAICPKCNYIENISISSNYLECTEHGQTELYWLGVKPLIDSAVKEKKPKKEKKKMTKTENKPVVHEKTVKQPLTVNFEDIKALPKCELWTRADVKFDHERINVKAHTLLFTGENPRKFCFNTYDGTLGKRSAPLPFEQFIKNEPVKNSGRAREDKPWFTVQDIEKARAKLRKDGYELHS